MPSSAESQQLQYQVLNFFYDSENSCALTALINNVRFHVIADVSKVRKGQVGQDYSRLLQAVKEVDIDEVEPETSDSGVDVSHGGNGNYDDKHATGAEEHLHRWMLGPLQPFIKELAPGSQATYKRTLQEWYNGPTNFFDLVVEDKHLKAMELEPSADLEGRVSRLLHQISVPRYNRQINVPWYQASNLTVLEGSNTPPPYHPSRVQTHGGNIYHVKLVDKAQPQPTKRELAILNSIAEKGLHGKLRCPKLEGLVALDDDRSKIIGFLQTYIPNSTPLTLKLDAEVPQELRDRWAAESQAMVSVLHDNDIVWGDAKADNFIVDDEGQLWIIDFGGSYTEGWVDAELNETEEGDDMGLEKIANALRDPVHNIWDPDTATAESVRTGGKRKANNDSPEATTNRSKRRRHDTSSSEELYCHCEKPGYGPMVACDGLECERRWFHFDCVGLNEAPSDNDEWLCEDCKSG